MSKRPTIKNPWRKFIDTTEDWYPNYPDNQVEVSFLKSLDHSGYCVCVWGDDDCGMERVYSNQEFAAARELYHNLVDNTTKKEMELLGMYQA